MIPRRPDEEGGTTDETETVDHISGPVLSRNPCGAFMDPILKSPAKDREPRIGGRKANAPEGPDFCRS